MTAIQLLEKLGAQKNFTTTQLSGEELSDITNLVAEKNQFMALLSNHGPDEEDEPDEVPEEVPAKQKTN